MILLLATFGLISEGEISHLLAGDIWLNKRDVWQADAEAHFTQLFVTRTLPSTYPAPLQLAPIGQPLLLPPYHIPQWPVSPSPKTAVLTPGCDLCSGDAILSKNLFSADISQNTLYPSNKNSRFSRPLNLWSGQPA